MKNDKPVLIVEDDSVDAMTIRRALKDIKVANELIFAENGEDALEYLNGAESRMPCIILLDLNMPKMNGIEFLNIIKNDDRLKMIPVIVLTTSSEESDRVASYRQQVAGYMIKPVDYRQFVEVMKTINLYWTISELPD